MAANDYYDFNPGPTTWAIMLTVFTLFVVALSVVLIVMVHRGEIPGPDRAERAEPPQLPVPAPRVQAGPAARAS